MKTKNAIFEDDFAISLDFLFKKGEKLPKDPPKSRLL